MRETRVRNTPNTSTSVRARPPARGNALLMSLLMTLLLSASCAIPISYYDGTTYKNLVELKVECTQLVKKFGTKTPPPLATVAKTQMVFDKAYEYEKGKGDGNSLTAESFEKIRGLWNEDVEDFKKELIQTNTANRLGKSYFEQAAVTLGQAFDIGIGTENAKNKDKK